MRIAHSDNKPMMVEYLGMGEWAIRWHVQNISEEDSETTLYEYWEELYKYKPSLSQIKELVISWYNLDIDKKILTGFVWNDMPIWLSLENQFNYKAAYDLAVQTNGSNLPITYKFGDTLEPLYHTFSTIEELNEFYLAAMAYINDTLSAGWTEKDNIDWSVYESYLE